MQAKPLKSALLFSASALGTFVLMASPATAQEAGAGIWQDAPPAASKMRQKAAATHPNRVAYLTRARQIELDTDRMRFALNQAPPEGSGIAGPVITLPLPGGGSKAFRVEYGAVMNWGLRADFPSIDTFKIHALDNPAHTGRLDIGPNGFHAIFDDGIDDVFIDPLDNGNRYQAYYKSDFLANALHHHDGISCTVNHDHDHANEAHRKTRQTRQRIVSYGTQMRTYRLAVAATGEYTRFHGGTKAQGVAAIVTAVNRINQVFERELGVKLELVANNADIVFEDADSDPFPSPDPSAAVVQATDVINNAIGAANYDIGHVFSTGTGGLASFASVCGPKKAESATGLATPVNDPFVIDFVSHEIGHQFGADHTFNGTCLGGRSADDAYEPGSGTTIMSYAGICGEQNVASGVHDNFHIHSLAQMTDFITDTQRGASCGMASTLNNAVPIVTGGPDGAIPAQTPFMLTGSATDADAGDALTYSWEQFDLGPETSSRAGLVDDGQRPIFRAFPPKPVPTRMFPKLSDVLTNTTTYGEVLPTTTRDLNFRLTVRDGKGGVASAARKLSVVQTTGAFQVTAPQDATTWAGNSQQTVTWDVAGTTSAPISCANIEMSLSTDGGQTFSTPFLTTVNDGSEVITVPDSTTMTGRLRLACATQPFFNVNDAAITITSVGTPPPNSVNQAPVAVADSYTVDQDSAATALTVLANDSDPDGDTLTLSAVSTPSNGGTATIDGRAISYQPATGISGTETFTYTITDSRGAEVSAEVTVMITPPPNQAPAAVDDQLTVAQGSAATLIPVLVNDTDPDGDTLSITAVSRPSVAGTATISGTSVSYQPAAGFNGSETFTYTVSDGRGFDATARVSVTVTAAPPSPALPISPGNNGDGPFGLGSFGLFMLGLLGLGRRFKAAMIRRRRRRISAR